MNKQFLLTLIVVLSVFLSVSAVCASEINVTDSYAASLVDDTSDVSVYNYAAGSDISVSSDSNVGNDSSKVSLSSDEVLESEDSNTLSTNTDSNKLTINEQNAGFDGVAFSDDTQSSLGANNKKDVYFRAPDRTLHVEDIYNGYDYEVYLRDSDGNALANKQVTLTFNGKKQTLKTNSRGRVDFNISVQKAGTYKVSLDFAGDSDYNALSCPDFRTVKVIKWNVTFVAPNKVFHVEDIYDGYSYGVTLRDSEGNALANQKVTITFNGVNQTKTTNANGRVYFNISVEKAGTYKVALKFDGTRYYYSSTCPDFRTISVIKWNTTLKAKDMSFDLDDISNGFIYPVFLKDSQGNALANKQITLTFNGKVYVNRTDSEGYCYFNLTVGDVGSYPVNIKFDGTRYYYSKSSSKTVDVTGVMKDVYFVAPNKKLHVDEISGGYSYGVTLRDTNGNPLANKPVTLTFNGKKQTVTTNKNGRAYFNLTVNKIGSYNVGLDFAGDKWYNPLSCPNFRTITVFGNNTKLTWKSESSFESGSQTFKVLLTDSNGVALANQIVKLTVNSKTYSEKTASNGYATFSLSLNANTYNVSYKYEGDDRYNPCNGSTKITVISKSLEGYGYFLFGRDMKSVNLNTLVSQGTTDLFLNYYAIELYGKSSVESWIASANKVGIRVHIWMQVFYEGYWINPVSNGAYNTQFSDSKIAEAKEYANIKGVSGILFDYLRYPGTAYKTNGGTAAITKFTKLATDAIHKINPNIIVSAAIMPETTVSAYYYGQDYSALSGILDAVLPMIYKGNYNSGSSWIASTTKWYVDNSKGAKVWVTLQAYKSDDDTSKLPLSELNNDIKIVFNAKASGVILFRYGQTNFPNFNNFK